MGHDAIDVRCQTTVGERCVVVRRRDHNPVGTTGGVLGDNFRQRGRRFNTLIHKQFVGHSL